MYDLKLILPSRIACDTIQRVYFLKNITKLKPTSHKTTSSPSLWPSFNLKCLCSRPHQQLEALMPFLNGLDQVNTVTAFHVNHKYGE